MTHLRKSEQKFNSVWSNRAGNVLEGFACLKNFICLEDIEFIKKNTDLKSSGGNRRYFLFTYWYASLLNAGKLQKSNRSWDSPQFVLKLTAETGWVDQNYVANHKQLSVWFTVKVSPFGCLGNSCEFRECHRLAPKYFINKLHVKQYVDFC